MLLRVHLAGGVLATISWLSWALAAGGCAGVSVYLWSVAESWVYQKTQSIHLSGAEPVEANRAAESNRATEANRLAETRHAVAAMLPRQWFPPDPSVLGQIEVRRIGLSAVIRSGMDAATLRKSVGHVAATPLPGEWGNSVLAGHRDTFFRGLRGIERGDVIRVVRAGSTIEYVVDGLAVTGPEAVEVMRPAGDRRLTLVTCYPFGYIGPAPRRFVVTARSPAAGNPEVGH